MKLNITEVMVPSGGLKPGDGLTKQTSALNIHNKNQSSPENSINDQVTLVILLDSQNHREKGRGVGGERK